MVTNKGTAVAQERGQREGSLAPPRRHPERGVAGLVEGPAVHRDARRPRHRAAREGRQGAVEEGHPEPHRVVAATCATAASTSAPRTARSTRVRAKNGKTIWTYGASGAVKAALAYSDGKLYFGAYGGRAYAIRASNGQRGLEHVDRRALAGAERQLLLHARRGVRARLHGEHGRARVLVHRQRRRDRVDEVDRVLRLLRAGGGVGARPRADRLHRLLHRPLLRPRRPLRRGALVVPVAGPDLRRRQRDRAASCTSRTSRRARRTASTCAPGKEVFRHKGGGFAPPISDGETLYLTGYATQLAFKPRKEAEGAREAQGLAPLSSSGFAFGTSSS